MYIQLKVCFLYKESNEDEIFKLTEELEELKITNESLQRVSKDMIGSSVTYRKLMFIALGINR